MSAVRHLGLPARTIGCDMTEPIEEPMPANSPDLDITFVLDGPVDETARDHAGRMIRSIVAMAPRPVIFARVKLAVAGARPAEEQAIAQGTLDVSGALVRAQVAAPTIVEAIDVLGDRLRRRLRRIAERREDQAERPPSTPEGEWRSGDLPSSRPGYYDRPPEGRRIVRRKAFAPTEISVEEAIFDLDVLDHRFFLFTDQRDGEDSVVYESDDGVLLRRLSGGRPPDTDDRPLPVEVNAAPAPELTAEEAKARLDVSGEPFVFFRDAGSGRGTVLYRRYDGHYGLVEPAG